MLRKYHAMAQTQFQHPVSHRLSHQGYCDVVDAGIPVGTNRPSQGITIVPIMRSLSEVVA